MTLNRYKLLALIWTVLVFVLSAMPGKDISNSFLGDLIALDKIAHFIFYFVMTLTWSLYMRDIYSIYKSMIISALLSISFGLTMEIMQKVYFIDRSFDWQDVLANLSGVLIGCILFLKYEKLFPIFAKS